MNKISNERLRRKNISWVLKHEKHPERLDGLFRNRLTGLPFTGKEIIAIARDQAALLAAEGGTA